MKWHRALSVCLAFGAAGIATGVNAYVIDDAIAFLASKPEIAVYVASLLARRLYYTTSYLVDLQQQAAGKREDLDLVDRILEQLVEKPEEPKASRKKK